MLTPINIDETILVGIARAFWVWAYSAQCETEEGADLPAAGPGEDWMDVAPETPIRAYLMAAVLKDRFERANKVACAWVMFGRAMKADDKVSDENDYETLNTFKEEAKLFGHYVAMQAMGHGVSWFDDHEKFPMVVPSSFDINYGDLAD